jgi:S1-C subfamily serine protease
LEQDLALLSADGYIVTNNHVIKDASEIEITLNKQSYKSKTHRYRFENGYRFAKIDAMKHSHTHTFGNSDSVKLANGFWRWESV